MQNELTRIEGGLVPVYETDTGEKVVYGSELHEVLGVKSRFNDWIRNRLRECDAIENEDFQTLTKNLVSGGQAKEYIIKLDTAKEMAMLERNEKGKQVRRYFIEIEKKYRMPKVPVTPMPPIRDPMQDLSPQLQLLISMELKQKETDSKVAELEGMARRQAEAMQAVKEAMADIGQGKEFSQWVTESIKRVAESKAFEENPYRYQEAWVESYKRLMDKAACDLDVLLKNAKKRAQRNGATKAQVKDISKLSVISNDKRLKALYISTIQEMVIGYCIGE